MNNFEIFRNNINNIYDQLSNPNNTNRVAILDENRNLIFVEANDPRVRTQSVNQLDYIKDLFKQFASFYKERGPFDRPTLLLTEKEKGTLLSKLDSIRQISLSMAQKKQSYYNFTKSMLGMNNPIQNAKNDMDKAINRIGSSIVRDTDRELQEFSRNLFGNCTTTVANLRGAAESASETIRKTIGSYVGKENSIGEALKSLSEVNSALSNLRMVMFRSYRDINDIAAICKSEEGKEFLNNENLKNQLRGSIEELYKTYIAIINSSNPYAETMTRVMADVNFQPSSESASSIGKNASSEEKTFVTYLTLLQNLTAHVEKVKDKTSPAALLLKIHQMNKFIQELSDLEKKYPGIIRTQMNEMNDEINKISNAIQETKQKGENPNELLKQRKELEAKVEKRGRDLSKVRSLFSDPIILRAKEYSEELKKSPRLSEYQDDPYKQPLNVDINFWLFDGLRIKSLKELVALDEALNEHDSTVAGMATSRKNPLVALQELQETVFGKESI